MEPPDGGRGWHWWGDLTMRVSSSKSRRALLPFQIVMAAIGASIGGIVAVLGDLRDELGFTDTEIGFVVTSGFAAAFVSQVTLARFADRGHGRAMATAGVMITVIALAAMTVADDVGWWIAARGALGFAAGLAMPGLRRAAAVMDPERVGENLGRMVVGEMGGFLAGPIVAAVFVETVGIRAPFVAFAVGMAVFVPFVVRLPPDQGAIDTNKVASFGLLRVRRLQGALLVIGGYFSLIGSWEAVMPIMFKDRGGGSLEVGIIFTVLVLPVLFLSPSAGRFADRVGPPTVAVVGTAVSAAGMTLFGIVPGLVWPVVVMLGFGVFDAFGFTAAQVAVSRSVPEERQAAALGLMGAVEVLGAGATALPAALLYDNFGAGPTWAASGLFSLAVVMLGALRFRGTHPAQTTAIVT